MQNQCFPEFAIHVTPCEDFAQVMLGSLIQQLGCGRKFSAGKHAYHHTCTTLFIRTALFYAKFHALLLKLILLFQCPIIRKLSL